MELGNKLILAAICLGYSKDELNGRPVFFKHPSLIDFTKVDEIYKIQYDKAVKMGLPNLEDLITDLDKNGQWTLRVEGQHEMKLAEERRILDLNKKAYAKAWIPSQLDLLEDEIEQRSKRIRELEFEKAELLSHSAEKMAEKFSNEHLILYISYADDKLKDTFVPEDEIEYVSDDFLIKLNYCFSKSIRGINTSTIRKIALSPYFRNLLNISSSQQFFRRDVFELSVFQTELLTYGNYYDTIVKNTEYIPQDLFETPDKFEEWYHGMKNTPQRAREGEDKLRQIRRSTQLGQKP